jgi:hypothetical protein
MPLVVSNHLQDLGKHAANNVCVIKGVLDRTLCDALVSAIDGWGQQRQPNQERGKNWWYRVKKETSKFDSFLFWQLENLEPVELRERLLCAYRVLFEAHVLCGTVLPRASFENLLADQGDKPSLDPLIFFYRPGTGAFQRHAHEPGYQKTQVLINLTKRNRDYAGGETLVEESDGNVVELGEVFDQGDLFSFPYPLFHSVAPVTSPNGKNGIGRMSILMPFHPRDRTNIRY